MFSTVLNLFVYSITVAFCQWASTLTYGLKPQSLASKLSLFTDYPFSKFSGSVIGFFSLIFNTPELKHKDNHTAEDPRLLN